MPGGLDISFLVDQWHDVGSALPTALLGSQSPLSSEMASDELHASVLEMREKTNAQDK